MGRKSRQKSHLEIARAERNLATSETKSTSDGSLEAENEQLRQKVQ